MKMKTNIWQQKIDYSEDNLSHVLYFIFVKTQVYQ